jgi:hypothetical protein
MPAPRRSATTEPTAPALRLAAPMSRRLDRRRQRRRCGAVTHSGLPRGWPGRSAHGTDAAHARDMHVSRARLLFILRYRVLDAGVGHIP